MTLLARGTMTAMAIADAEIEEWSTWLRAAGRPDTTIYLRSYQVRRVFRGVGLSPWDVTTEELVHWLAGQQWKADTRRSFRTALRVFFTWAKATGRRTDNPAELIPAVKVPRGIPRPTPDQVYRDALHAPERERLMVQLAAVCGLRRGEISRLRREDLGEDLLGPCLMIVGKGGHERSVPVPGLLARTIQSMPPGYLFPSSTRPGQPLTPEHVGKLVSRLLPDGWTCHSLRHRCATVAYAATRDLRAVQELLGHAKPETTARYTEVPKDAVRAAVAAAAA